MDTRSFINPEGFSNRSRIPHGHDWQAAAGRSPAGFLPLKEEHPARSADEPWRVAILAPGTREVSPHKHYGKNRAHERFAAKSRNTQPSAALVRLATPVHPVKKPIVPVGAHYRFRLTSSPNALLAKSATNWGTWSAADARVAKEEHAAALREQRAIEQAYVDENISLDERQPILHLTAVAARRAFRAALFAPAVLCAVAVAAGLNLVAIALVVVLPSVALLAAWVTPLNTPVELLPDDEDESGTYDDPRYDRRRLSLAMPSPHITPQIDFNEEPSLKESQMESRASAAQYVLFSIGLCQLVLACSWKDLHENVVATALVASCAVFQLVTVITWMLADMPRDECCGKLMALSVLDRGVAHLRMVRMAILRATERELVGAVEQFHRWTHKRRSDGDVVLPADDLLLGPTLIPSERPSCFASCCMSLGSRGVASLNAIGGLVRQSPLGTLVASLNLAIAADGVADLSPVAAVSLIAAVAGAVTMTEYVRRGAHEIEYAEGLRSETERREEKLTLRRAEAGLQRALLPSLDDIESETLARAIEEAEAAPVSALLVEYAHERLRHVNDNILRRTEELKLQHMQENARINEAKMALGAVAASAPLEMDLGKLMVAIDEARSASVPRSVIAEAEARLREATQAQARRDTADARLHAYLGPLDELKTADEQKSAPAEGTEDAEGGTATTNASDFAGIDLKELDSVVEEARVAGVPQLEINKVLLIRKQVVKAQMHVEAAVTLAQMKLRQRGVQARWRKSDGDQRLAKATRAGRAAIALLRDQSESGPLQAATEALAVAIDEAASNGVLLPEVTEGESVLRSLREATDGLEKAHVQLDNALDAAEDIRSYDHMMRVAHALPEAIKAGTEARADVERLRLAEASMADVHKKIRACGKAEERLAQSEEFVVEHLARFRARQSTQLKMLAVPSLESAISVARASFVIYDMVHDAEERLREAKSALIRVEEATQWLSTASKASVKALSRAAENRGEALSILHVASETLMSAIAGAKEDGVDPADIASAEALLSTLRKSGRRNSVRHGGARPPPALPAAMLAQYAHVTGHERA